MRKETIEKLIENYDGEDLASYISDILELEKILKRKIRTHKIESEGEKKRHEDKLIALRKELRTIQQDCPHHETTFYPDASGGSDSCTLCDLCNKAL